MQVAPRRARAHIAEPRRPLPAEAQLTPAPTLKPAWAPTALWIKSQLLLTVGLARSVLPPRTPPIL